MISHYLIDIIILLLATVIIVPFTQAIHLGAVPGFLLAGVLIGPFGLGLVNNTNEIRHFAEIGVVFLLFIIGIELKPSRLWLMRRLVFGLGALQVFFTGILLAAVVYFYFELPLRTAVVIGPALALSSTAFVLQLLTEQKLLTSIYGRTSFAVLLFQDLAVVPLLALVSLLTMPQLTISEDIGLALVESLVIFGLVVIIGRYLLHPILHRVALSGNSEVFTASALLIVLGAALIIDFIGLSMVMGAFLAGLLISDSSYKHQVMAEIQPFRGLLLGLFFISMGMSFNVYLLLDNPLFTLLSVSLLMGIKIVVFYPIAYLFGVKSKNSLAVSLILAQSGEFALVIFSLAYQAELLSDSVFQQLLLVVLLSIMITPALAYMAQRIIKTQQIKKIKDPEKPIMAPIILAGFGHVGRRVGEILTLVEQSFVALDYNAKTVEKGRKQGYPVFYGNACQPELLKVAGISNAKLIIITINDSAAVKRLVLSLRKSYPNIKIYTRSHSLNQCYQLRQLGASCAVSENLEASIELARMVLLNFDLNEIKQQQILDDFRKKYHDKINKIEISSP